MSDRSLGDTVGGTLFWTAVIHYFPSLVRSLFGGIGGFLKWFIFAGFGGWIIQVVANPDAPHKGPVSYADLEVSAVGTLDYLDVTVWNHDTEHEIKLLSLNCGGQSVMLRHVLPSSSKGYSGFAGNIRRGTITCEIERVHS